MNNIFIVGSDNTFSSGQTSGYTHQVLFGSGHTILDDSYNFHTEQAYIYERTSTDQIQVRTGTTYHGEIDVTDYVLTAVSPDGWGEWRPARGGSSCCDDYDGGHACNNYQVKDYDGGNGCDIGTCLIDGGIGCVR